MFISSGDTGLIMSKIKKHWEFFQLNVIRAEERCDEAAIALILVNVFKRRIDQLLSAILKALFLSYRC